MTKKQNGELVTKSFLKSELEVFGQKLKEEIVGEVVVMKDEIVTMKDEIVKELRDMREEFNVHQFSHRRINDELEDHEDRIGKLEKTTPSG